MEVLVKDPCTRITCKVSRCSVEFILSERDLQDWRPASEYASQVQQIEHVQWHIYKQVSICLYVYTYRLEDPVLRSDNLLHDAQHVHTRREIKARKSFVHIRCTSVSVCFQPRYAHQTLIVYDLYYEHCPFIMFERLQHNRNVSGKILCPFLFSRAVLFMRPSCPTITGKMPKSHGCQFPSQSIRQTMT